MNRQVLVTFTFLALLALVIGAPTVEVNDKDTNMTKGGKSKQLADSKPQLTPLEQGMQPIFFITKYFLNNILQPDDSGPPDVLIQSVAQLINQDMTTDQLLVHLESNWQQIATYYLGFGICVVIGLLFIIIMPIVGFCFCCCRICGNCGGNAGQMDPKFARCKHVTYTVFLLLITTLMLAGVVCAFVTNDMLHRQVTDKDRGYISNVNRSITGVEQYMDNTIQEIKTDVVKEVNKGIDQVAGMMNRTGSVVIDEVKAVTGAGALLENITNLGDDIPKLKLELDTLSQEIASTKTEATQLASSLASVKNEVTNGLQGCALADCANVRTRTNELIMNLDMNQIPDLDPIIKSLDKYVKVKDQVRDAKAEFDKIGTEMTKKVQLEIDNAVRELDATKAKIDSQMNKLEVQISNMSGSIGSANKYLEVIPKGSTVEKNAVFVGVGLSCLFLLIVMLLYMGMTFGVCGERAYDDARFCNKGVGANFLMAGVGFMFMTSAILMLITLIMFLIGAPLQTEVCRHLMTPLKSPFVDKIDGYLGNYLGEMLYGSRSDSLTIKEVLTSCENNTSIYLALKLNKTYDIGAQIDQILTQMEPEIQKLVNDVKGQPAQTIEVINKQLENKLAQMKVENDFNTNLDTAIAELKKPITTLDLTTYITDLEMLGMNTATINNAITTLKGLNDNQIPMFKQRIDKIRASLEQVKRVNNIQTKVGEIETRITQVQQKLDTSQQAQTMADAATQTGQKILELVRTLANDLNYMIENDIGRCRPIYNSYFTVVSATCEDVLNPLNSFWCAYGLCLLLFIPAIIFAVKLAGLYRKTDKYVGKPFESLGGSNVYPGDHIPLDDVGRKPPPYRDGRGHHGAPSTGYDNNSSAPPLEYGQGMLDFEMPYAVPARKGLYPPHNRDNRPLLDQQM